MAAIALGRRQRRAKGVIMIFTADEILETLDMILYEHLDIRTVTVGVNLTGCVRDDPERMAKAVHDKICLLYTSDAADEEDSVDLGGRRIIKKKKKKRRTRK